MDNINRLDPNPESPSEQPLNLFDLVERAYEGLDFCGPCVGDDQIVILPPPSAVPPR
jgi:hypothetical protein